MLHQAFAPVVVGKDSEGIEETINPARVLVTKLIEVLENVEKLPVFTHDSPGSSHGLQVRVTKQTKTKKKR